MRESSTYQAVLDEGRAEGEARGRAEGARRVVLRLGTRRFGPPDRRTRAALQAIADVEQIEQLGDRVLDASSWAELLDSP
jgi:predicted transposase YdaD